MLSATYKELTFCYLFLGNKPLLNLVALNSNCCFCWAESQVRHSGDSLSLLQQPYMDHIGVMVEEENKRDGKGVLCFINLLLSVIHMPLCDSSHLAKPTCSW